LDKTPTGIEATLVGLTTGILIEMVFSLNLMPEAEARRQPRNELIRLICAFYEHPHKSTVDVSNLGDPTQNVAISAYGKNDHGTRKRRSGGYVREPTRWKEKYGMPFRPGSDFAEIWKILAKNQPIDIRSLEDKIRQFFFGRHRRNLGLKTGYLLYYLLRRACDRGWEVMITDAANPVTFGKLSLRYVGNPTELNIGG